MPLELDQPAAAITPEIAISALLCLFHQHAMSGVQGAAPARLGQRIYRNLESLSRRDDLPEILQRTCDDLCEAWQQALDRQPARRQ